MNLFLKPLVRHVTIPATRTKIPADSRNVQEIPPNQASWTQVVLQVVFIKKSKKPFPQTTCAPRNNSR